MISQPNAEDPFRDREYSTDVIMYSRRKNEANPSNTPTTRGSRSVDEPPTTTKSSTTIGFILKDNAMLLDS
jgi:hypothetical protein